MSTTVGILGIGYLGKQLLASLQNHKLWGTYHQTNPLSADGRSTEFRSIPSHCTCVKFQWEDPETWHALPAKPASLILTIPPVLKDEHSEVQRLSKWGKWMKLNRPQLNKLIYVSSTGVYPNKNGVWKEYDEFIPDSLSGQLRLATEKALNEYFELSVVRPGGIYGPGRHIGLRALRGKKISLGEKPIHRIHVKDLANIIKLLLDTELCGMPECRTTPTGIIINAVDKEPKPSREVLKWLVAEKLIELPKSVYNQIDEEIENPCNVESLKNRIISNKKLLNDMNFKFRFPTYQEGFSNILKNQNLPNSLFT